jgi:hypothetical protein
LWATAAALARDTSTQHATTMFFPHFVGDAWYDGVIRDRID